MATNTAPFDLNQAIQQWRESLSQSPAFRWENLDELESHLCDSIANLGQRGLAADEAFLIATRRVGSGAALGVEFGKINAQGIWMNRAIWMLVGIELFHIVINLASVITFYTAAFGIRPVLFSGEDSSSSLYAGLIVALVHLLTFAVLFASGWRLLTKKGASAYAWFRNTSKSSGRAVVISGCFLLVLLPRAVQMAESAWYSKFAMRYPMPFVVALGSGNFYASLVEWAAPIALILLLARRQWLAKTWA